MYNMPFPRFAFMQTCHAGMCAYRYRHADIDFAAAMLISMPSCHVVRAMRLPAMPPATCHTRVISASRAGDYRPARHFLMCTMSPPDIFKDLEQQRYM